MKKRYYIIVACIGFIFLSSCIKEDRDKDCPPDGPIEADSRELMFRLKPSKYSFSGLVESLKLHLYDDADNRLMDTKEFTGAELRDNDYQVSLDSWVQWQDNHHHIVAIMNECSDYQITDEQLMTSFRTHILPHVQDSVINKINDIFIGYYELRSASSRANVLRDTMVLEKLTNHIYVTVEFRGYTFPQDHRLITNIRGTNAVYDYLNQRTNSAAMTYMAHTESAQSSRLFNYELTTGKLFIGDDLKLSLEDYDATGRLANQIQLALTEEIISLKDNNGNYIYDTQEELEEEDEFYLNFVLDDQFTIVELRINNWYTVNPGVDL